MTPSARREREARRAWPAYAAAAWAFAFAAVSAYWALGGTAGVETVAAEISRVPLANNRAFVGATAALKALAGLLALALVRPWGERLPRQLLLAAAWLAGALLTLYGVANLIDHGRMVAGLRAIPPVLGERAARWHLLFWDPVWLLGVSSFSRPRGRAVAGCGRNLIEWPIPASWTGRWRLRRSRRSPCRC